MKKQAIILANGKFPESNDLIERLRTAEYLICCDGAINNLERLGIEPHSIVGDLDSISKERKEKYKDIIHHFSEQITNDLTKSVNWSIKNGFQKITILGASGKREDHTIGNIFLLLRYIHEIEVVMISDYGTFTPIFKTKEFKSYKGEQVSIFSPNPYTKISTKNLRYPIKNEALPELWNGTLNESLGDKFEINLENGALVIYQAK